MEPAPELCALLQSYYAAAAQGDARILDQLIARNPGTLVIGTDATEWWRGGDEIVRVWSAAWQQRGGLPVQNSHPQAFRAGNVGWADDQAEWHMPDGRTLPFRLSAVFLFTNNQWQLVQAHFSLGVPNDSLGRP